MNVRYCEVFLDPQRHTSRGISWDVMMGGFKEAQIKAENKLNVGDPILWYLEIKCLEPKKKN